MTVFGCGNSNRVPVSGKVLFNGGDWPKPGVIYFNPLEPADGYPRLSGIGTFESDGSFTVEAAGGTRGLVPGKYTVRVECWKVEPTMAEPEGASYIPKTFEFPVVEIEVGASSKNVELNVTAQ